MLCSFDKDVSLYIWCKWNLRRRNKEDGQSFGYQQQGPVQAHSPGIQTKGGNSYRSNDGHEVSLRLLVIQTPVDGHLSLMWQVNSKESVPISDCNSTSSDSIGRCQVLSIPRNDGVLDETVDSRVDVPRLYSLVDGRPDGCQLKTKKDHICHSVLLTILSSALGETKKPLDLTVLSLSLSLRSLLILTINI